MPQKACHLRRRTAVVLDERADHPGLVERGRGARRRVDRQQQLLVLRGPRGRLDNHGDHRVALLPPPSQALESVEYLEDRALGGAGTWCHAQRKLGAEIGTLADD